MKSSLKYLYGLSALIYFTQGFGALASQPLFYYLKETLNLPISRVLILLSLISIPWTIKPLYGFLSDNFPLFGYRRKSYIILSSLLSITTCLLLGGLSALPLGLLLALLIADSLGGAIKDVVVDGLMVEEGRKNNSTGKIQSTQWTALTIATVLTGVLGGWISEKFDYHLAFYVICLFPLCIGLFVLPYKEEPALRNRVSLKSIALQYFQALKDKQFLLAAAFLFCLWFSPSIGTLTLARYREELHFSKMWIGMLSTIGSVASIIGALIYFKINQNINQKRWIFITTLLNGLSTLAYLYFTSTSVLLYAILFGISGMFTHLIILNFMAKACPKGIEATIFALLCSVLNLSAFLSGLFGGYLTTYLSYNQMVIISSSFTFICLLFIPYLKFSD